MMKVFVLSAILLNLIIIFDVIHCKNVRIKNHNNYNEKGSAAHDDAYYYDQLADETVATSWPSNRLKPIQKGSDGKNKYIIQVAPEDEVIVHDGNPPMHEMKNVKDVNMFGSVNHDAMKHSTSAKNYVTAALQTHDTYYNNGSGDQDVSSSNLTPVSPYATYTTASYDKMPETAVKKKPTLIKVHKIKKQIVISGSTTTPAPHTFMYTTKNLNTHVSDVIPLYEDYSTPKLFTPSPNVTMSKSEKTTRAKRPSHTLMPLSTASYHTLEQEHQPATVYIKPKNTQAPTVKYLNSQSDTNKTHGNQYSYNSDSKSSKMQTHLSDDNKSFYFKHTDENKRLMGSTATEETYFHITKKPKLNHHEPTHSGQFYQMGGSSHSEEEGEKANSKVAKDYRTFENDVSDPVAKPIYVATYPETDNIDKLSYHDPDEMLHDQSKNQEYFVLYHIDEKKAHHQQPHESQKHEVLYHHEYPEEEQPQHQYHNHHHHHADAVLLEEPGMAFDTDIAGSDFIKIIDTHKPAKTIELTKDEYTRHVQQAALRYMKEMETREKLSTRDYDKPKTYYRTVERPSEIYEPQTAVVSTRNKYKQHSDSYHMPSKTVISVLPTPTPVTYKSTKPTQNSYKVVSTLKMPKTGYGGSGKHIKTVYETISDNSMPSHIDLTVKNMKSTSKPDLSAIDVGQSYIHDSPFDHGAALKSVQGFDLSNAVHGSGAKSPKTKLHFNQQTYHDINAMTNGKLNMHHKEREAATHISHMPTSTLKPGYYKGYSYGEPSSFQTVKGGTANVGASISFGGKLQESEMEDSSAAQSLDSPIQIINGIPVANPYNIDMNTLRYMLGGLAQAQATQTMKATGEPFKMSGSNWNSLGAMGNSMVSHQPQFEQSFNVPKYNSNSQESYAAPQFKILSKTKYTKTSPSKENFSGFAEANYASWENNRMPVTKTRGNSNGNNNDMYVSSSNSLPNYMQGQTIVVKTVKKSAKGKSHNHVRTLEQELRPPPSHRLIN